MTFIGPSPEALELLGNKVQARNLAAQLGIPIVLGSPTAVSTAADAATAAAAIGYPIMLKASWGGGGRGMRTIRNEGELLKAANEARREAQAAFGKDEIYLEKLVERARHVEAQNRYEAASQQERFDEVLQLHGQVSGRLLQLLLRIV